MMQIKKGIRAAVVVSCLTLVGLPLVSGAPLFAQGTDIDINELRKELARAQVSKGSERADDSLPGFRPLKGSEHQAVKFEVADVEIADSETQDLLSAEAKLLKQLKANDSDAPLSDFARDEIEATGDASAKSPTASKTASGSVAHIQDKIKATDAALTELDSDISAQMASLGREREASTIQKVPAIPAPAIERKDAAQSGQVTAVVQEAKEKKQILAPTRVTSNVADEAVAKMEAASRQLSTLQRDTASLRVKLSNAEQKNALLTKQLAESRSRLLVAETEVERLSGIIEQRSAPRVSSVSSSSNNQRVAANPVAAPARTTSRPAAQPAQRESDMPFVTVMVDKANLRLGPTAQDSPVMTVSRGTRLTVETRQGPWYRVYAPNGNRLWVSADVVAFGKDGMSGPTDTVRIQGIRSNPNADNFRFPE
jgi:hypothetical protein